ncbi:MAG: patatin-like phospholipase family protein [Proteobacteria bacterium]|nr:patatin-like phospholipase family protein [Pseudomonadota bacterium]
MKNKDKKTLRDLITEIGLVLTIIECFSKGVYEETQVGNQSKKALAEAKLKSLKAKLYAMLDDDFKKDVEKNLHQLENNIKKANKDRLNVFIASFHKALDASETHQVANLIFSDEKLEGNKIKTPLPKSKNKITPKQPVLKPKHLILSGGGIKGVAYETVFETLQNNNLLDGIETCYGSSVGGLSAALLALGYNLEDTKKNMSVTEDTLLDPFRNPLVGPTSKAFMVKNLISHAGIAKGYKLFELSQKVVANKLGDPNATFKDLEKKFGQSTKGGGKFRHLTVTATVKDPRRGFYQVVLNAKTVPNMPIALAMRMTAGLPPVFRGVEITPQELEVFRKGATEPMVQYDRGPNFPKYDPKNPKDDIPVTIENRNAIKFIDGGVTDNLPIYLPLQNGSSPNEYIALNFIEPWRIQHREDHKEMFAKGKTLTEKDEAQWIISQNLKKNDKAYYYYQQKRYKSPPSIPPSHFLKAEQANAMINIPTDDVQAAEFGLSEERKEILRKHGKEAAENYLRSNNIELKQVPATSQNTQAIVAQHNDHQEVLKRAKGFLSKKLGLEDNADYKAFKKHVDKTGEKIVQLHQLQSKTAFTLNKAHLKQITKDHFNTIYELRNETDAAFASAKKEISIAHRSLYGLWENFGPINSLIQSVSPQTHRQFETLKEFKGVIRALNSSLKVQRIASMEKGKKKFMPTLDSFFQKNLSSHKKDPKLGIHRKKP